MEMTSGKANRHEIAAIALEIAALRQSRGRCSRVPGFLRHALRRRQPGAPNSFTTPHGDAGTPMPRFTKKRERLRDHHPSVRPFFKMRGETSHVTTVRDGYGLTQAVETAGCART